MKLLHKQKGLSSIGWLLAGITVYLYSIIAVKIVPIYLNDLTVKSTMEKLSKTQGASAFELRDVVNVLETEFDVNNIRNIDLNGEGVITIDKSTGSTVVELNYEQVANVVKSAGMFQTMDIVVRLKHKAVLK